MNKSFITNFIAALITAIGYFTGNAITLSMGLFALSGAITNWLAIYMLFEKVPGLYGSGVIPARFEDFKAAIRNLMMDQFFTEENIDRFISGGQNSPTDLHLGPVIEKVDFSPAFESLIEVIMNSSFGSMLGMLGGEEALFPLKEPFIKHMKSSLINMTQQDEFKNLLKEELEQPDVMADIRGNVEEIIEKRLNELTPQLVKEIIQNMIREHLGWLVIWGGVFGGLIGLVAALLSTGIA